MRVNLKQGDQTELTWSGIVHSPNLIEISQTKPVLRLDLYHLFDGLQGLVRMRKVFCDTQPAHPLKSVKLKEKSYSTVQLRSNEFEGTNHFHLLPKSVLANIKNLKVWVHDGIPFFYINILKFGGWGGWNVPPAK